MLKGSTLCVQACELCKLVLSSQLPRETLPAYAQAAAGYLKQAFAGVSF